jgi:tRNA (cmo5U34)-methyltransferase
MNSFSNISYEVADLQQYSFNDKYEVVVSSLALHHLTTDGHKRTFYKKIFDCLNTGGVFYNADVVLSSSYYLQELNIKKWKEYMRKSVPEDEIETRWMNTYRTEDNPAQLITQLEWLKEIGFSEIDVIWKYFNFAVYGGQKQ